MECEDYRISLMQDLYVLLYQNIIFLGAHDKFEGAVVMVYPLQKWICAAYVLRLWCSECCTCANCTYVCAEHVQATAIPHICATCMLLVYVTFAACMYACYYSVIAACILTRAACIHAYYYSVAYTLLTHMQAASVPHMCSLHTCM